MQGKGRAASAALAVLVVAGLAGCGAGDGAEGTPPPVPPRPAGTGPLTKDAVRADVEGVLAAADAPPDARDFSRGMEEDRLRGCAVFYKGFGDREHPADLARYEAVTDGLRGRAWRFAGKGNGHEERGGKVHRPQEIFEQRGWTLVTEFGPGADEGVGTLGVVAYDEACMERTGLMDTFRKAGS
ncbi:hypothetical protein ABT117_29835 [Streptomyces sp. NPDC002262]|uniref:hypothetical protein n=1 Tax=unclassified Streptomyces TaxID=2593676 RepID=UPI00332EE1B5